MSLSFLMTVRAVKGKEKKIIIICFVKSLVFCPRSEKKTEKENVPPRHFQSNRRGNQKELRESNGEKKNF